MLKYLLSLVLLAALSNIALADLILDVISDNTWDRTSDPSGISITFRVSSNTSAPNANLINGFSVGLSLIPDATAEGELRLLSVSVPQANPVFPTYAAPPNLQNLADSLQTISADNGVFANVSVPAGGLNLFTVRVASPANDARGQFRVFADPNTSNYFITSEFEGLKFGNAPLGAGGASGVLLGTIDVSAIPEPTSAIFLGIVCAIAVASRQNRRQC